MSEIYVFIILFLSPGLQSGLHIKLFKLVFMQNQVSQARPKLLLLSWLHRVSQEECARLREGVPYVKVYRNNPKHLCPQSWTVMEIMAREKCGLLAGPRTVPVSWRSYPYPSLSVVSYCGNSAHSRSKLLMYFLLGDKAGHVSVWHSCHV